MATKNQKCLTNKQLLDAHDVMMDLQSKIKNLQNSFDEFKDSVKGHMEKKGLLKVFVDDQLLFTWMDDVTPSFDQTKFRTEQPKLYEKYRTKVLQRFLVK